jgi:hypothetical protein
VISQAHGYRAQCHGPWQASRTVSRRLEALFCLLIILAQLALVVAHSWEVSVEEGAISAARTSRAFLKDARGAPALSKAATVPRRHAHDPLLCPLCQLLSQAKNGLAPHGPGIFLPQTSFMVLLGSSFHSSDLDRAAAAPRAPPYFL